MDLNAAGAVGTIVAPDYSDPQVSLDYVKALLVDGMHNLIATSISNDKSLVTNLQTMQQLGKRVLDRMAQQGGSVDANVVNTYHSGEALAQRFAADSGNLGRDLAESEALLQDLHASGVKIDAALMYPVLKTTTTTSTDALGNVTSSTANELVWMNGGQRGGVGNLAQKNPNYGHAVYGETTGTAGNSVETNYECLDEFANLRVAPNALGNANAQIGTATDALQKILEVRTDEGKVSVAYLNRAISDLDTTSKDVSKTNALRRTETLVNRQMENIRVDDDAVRRLAEDARTVEHMKPGNGK